MEQPLPSIGRTTFVIHVVVAVCVGLPLLVAPLAFGALFGYPGEPGLVPVLRAFGAMLLVFGGLTSFYGTRAPTWAHVDFIVRGEMGYLGVQTLVFAASALSGVGPALGNWAFVVCSGVLFVLFAATFAARPRTVQSI
jgi:hypothetical protein